MVILVNTVNTRWKILAEIYTIHSFAPFSKLNVLVEKMRFLLMFDKMFANFGSQEVQKMNMKMEIRKRKMGMIQKETF